MIGGEKEGEGRVELCVDGFWGTVCGDGFDQKAAFVICRHFGFHKTARMWVTQSVYYKITTSHVTCSITRDCTKNAIGEK